ncbi:hypothetical protein T440DRAFT_384266, partial [Plenodomus tracheiphilus IPT5]
VDIRVAYIASESASLQQKLSSSHDHLQTTHMDFMLTPLARGVHDPGTHKFESISLPALTGETVASYDWNVPARKTNISSPLSRKLETNCPQQISISCYAATAAVRFDPRPTSRRATSDA